MVASFHAPPTFSLRMLAPPSPFVGAPSQAFHTATHPFWKNHLQSKRPTTCDNFSWGICGNFGRTLTAPNRLSGKPAGGYEWEGQGSNRPAGSLTFLNRHFYPVQLGQSCQSPYEVQPAPQCDIPPPQPAISDICLLACPPRLPSGILPCKVTVPAEMGPAHQPSLS